MRRRGPRFDPFFLVVGVLVLGGVAAATMRGAARGGSLSFSIAPMLSASRLGGDDEAWTHGADLPAAGRLVESDPTPPDTTPAGTATRGIAPPVVDAGSAVTTFRPRSVRLPSGRVTRVRDADVHPDGSLAVPEDPTELGWWTGGAMAGEPYGGLVLAGHVDSRESGIGALAELRDVRAGAEVRVSQATAPTGTATATAAAESEAAAPVAASEEVGDAPWLRYRVTAVRSVPQARLSARTDVFAQDVQHRLVLITCGGKFDRETRRYTENVVVIAEPLR